MSSIRAHATPPRVRVRGLLFTAAEAVLELRATRRNGDFDAYWRYHLGQEQRRSPIPPRRQPLAAGRMRSLQKSTHVEMRAASRPGPVGRRES
jgi:predicted kinase